MNRRLLFWAVLALALGGAAFYAYVNPAFATTCHSCFGQGGAGIRQLVESSKNSLKRTDLYTSVAQKLRERAVREAATRAAPKPAPAAPKAATSAPQSPRPSLLTTGEQIASGHAFAQHGFEFGFKSEAEMAKHIDRVIAHPFSVKRLIRGRTAYWDDDTHSVVILDPNARDGGTAFKPERGRFYFDSLR